MKVLAVKLRRLGDTVLWTAALEALRQLPEISVDIAFPAEYLTLFAQDPRFSSLFPVPKKPAERTMLFYSLRHNRYDYVLNFHASRSSAWLCSLVGAQKKVIHSHSRHSTPLDSDLKIPHLGRAMAATERDLNVVRALGWTGFSPAPRLYVKSTVGSQNKGRTLLLSPFASRPAKQWQLVRYAELATQLQSHWNVEVIAESRALMESARALFPKHTRFTLTSTLAEALVVVQNASYFVGSDSGLKHMACALGVPTLTLFGPESIGEWHCYSNEKHRVIQKNVGCRSNDPKDPKFAWCGESLCPLSSHACMNLISVDEVSKQISQFPGT